MLDRTCKGAKRNKANFRQGRAGRGPRNGGRGIVQTNPISGRQTEGWEVPPSPIAPPAFGLPVGRPHLLAAVNGMGIIGARANDSITSSDWED